MAIQEAKPKPRNDAYTGLLAISFLALVGATVFMVLDIDQVGKPPAKLTIDVPGMTPPGKVDPLRRPDVAGKIDTTDAAPPPPKPMEPPMSRAPGKLPEGLGGEAASGVVPVKAEIPVESDGPPLPVKPFVPPM